MKIIYSLEPTEKGQSIFLAGPTLRTTQGEFSSVDSWRKEAISILEQRGFTGIVYVPEFRDNIKSDDWTYSRQVSWESKALKESDVILFWIPRDKDILPGFTTNIEFGEWLHSNKIVIGGPEDAYKNRYLQERCSHLKITWNYYLKEVISEALNKLNKEKESKIFFASDTHFGEERTMQLSKRPFSSVGEMDWTLIANWNKTVTNNDIVYHLGDFGNPNVLKYLNCKQIFMVIGNYDKDSILEELKKDKRFTPIPESHGITLNNNFYKLIHYPENIVDPNGFYLYGHIHSLVKVMENGLNVGVDCHNYSPISVQDVEFYRNAILNHYDHNVFPNRPR